MSESASPNPGADPSIQVRLQELSNLLRDAKHLDPEVQRELADLMDQLARTIGPGGQASPETLRLSENAAHLVEALHEQHDEGLLKKAMHRLEESVVRAEASAPLATGIVRQLLDVLANLGM